MTSMPLPVITEISKIAEPKKNRFIGAKMKRSAKFMGEDIEIVKLSVAQVLTVRELANGAESIQDELGNLKVLSAVVKNGAPELSTLTEEELNEFPVDELTSLSNEIMTFSGLTPNVQPVPPA